MTDPTAMLRAAELFPTDRPLAADELLGRDDEVASIVDDLIAGNHRALTGADQSGKTSVALAASGDLGAEWTVVSVDLLRVPSPDRLVATLLDARRGHSDHVVPTRAVGTAISRLDAEAADDGRRILLLVDGFHELATTQIFGKIAEVGHDVRAALDATTHTVGLFVGGAATVMRDLFTSKGQPFHQLATVTTLPRIDAAAWRSGLAERFDLGGCPAGDAALDRLLVVGEQHARSTMLVAQHAYALAVTAGHSTLGAEAVDAGFETALAGERPLADHRLAQVRSLSKHALTTALRVATDESPYKNLPPAMARQTLRSLETAGIVDHPKSGVYTIGDPLLRRYLVGLSTGDNAVAPPPGRINPVLAAALAQIAPATPPAPVVAPAVEEPPGPHASSSVVEQGSANRTQPAPTHSASAPTVVEPAAELEPVATIEPEPVGAVAGPEPTATDVVVVEPAVEPVPVATVEPEPVAGPKPPATDVVMVEPAAEPEPVITIELEPVTTIEPEPVAVDAGPELIAGEFVVVEAAIEPEPVATVEPQPVVADAARLPIAAEFVVVVPAAEPEPANAPVAGVESVGSGDPAAAAVANSDRRRLRLRHPRRDEADHVRDCVTYALDPQPASERSRGSRLGRFVRHAVANDPEQYWQVEAGKRPLGGVVLHEPGAAAGSGFGPAAHAAFLAVTGLLLVVGLVLLVVERAWDWGAYAGLIFAAFIAALVQVVQLAPRVLARARASIAARRRGGQVVAAVWSEPDALLEVFRQLAHELPGEHLSGYVESPAHIEAFRDIGFAVGRNRIVEGILDPAAERPVRSTADMPRPAATSGPSAGLDVATGPPASPAATATATTATRPPARPSTAHRAKHRRRSHKKQHRR